MKKDRKNTVENKIFVVGFHRTGTSSLYSALEYFGYDVSWTFGQQNSDIAEEVPELCYSKIASYDAFQDVPWFVIYKRLDYWSINSKFILTYRPIDDWINSAVNYFNEHETETRKWIYGENYAHPAGNEYVYMKRYRRHLKEVREHFDGRKDFMEIDVTTDESDEVKWKKLCNFLNQEVPENEPFPHENKSTY